LYYNIYENILNETHSLTGFEYYYVRPHHKRSYWEKKVFLAINGLNNLLIYLEDMNNALAYT